MKIVKNQRIEQYDAYQCEVCNKQYPSAYEAEICEKKHQQPPVAKFKIGDVVYVVDDDDDDACNDYEQFGIVTTVDFDYIQFAFYYKVTSALSIRTHHESKCKLVATDDKVEQIEKEIVLIQQFVKDKCKLVQVSESMKFMVTVEPIM